MTIAQYDEAIFLDISRNIACSGLSLRSMDIKGKFYFEHTLPLPSGCDHEVANRQCSVAQTSYSIFWLCGFF